ncbi:MAG: hypothetical protein WHS64_06850 [Fervidobacterium sp.]|uniref:Phosphoenolpyruvate carboxykinase (ATP) n=1 Tax=Fervidobacterium gondwanense DSM 13020 TaxID=1121883 RepID=A0A1M7T544_FERGO|nr:hypothetical protein [Fervidobacterium gondwanense]UXF00726.1 hypothetical protein IB67_03930 [Fervidobacterium riparium]SHN65860.1 hypothetical protein SAMN02745226_01552 [Fervidobacterium gondwanense DSM 13020]
MGRSVIIDGSIVYTDSSEILSNPGFEALLREYIDVLKERNSPLLRTLEAFRIGEDYDIRHIVEYLHLLTLRNIREITTIINYVNPEDLAKFVESFYSFWRNKHRFMMKRESYTLDSARKTSIVFTAAMVAEEFKNLVRNLYRTIMKNIISDNTNIIRQLPSGAQVTFLVDTFECTQEKLRHFDNVPVIWGAIFDPPVIFYTKSNKRKGTLPVVENRVLDRIKLPNKERDWYLVPILAAELLIYIYVHKEFLSHAAGLGNLFQFAELIDMKSKQVSGVLIFGLQPELIPDYKPEWKNGVIFKEENTYIGVIPALDENDYFGYMKKTILTLHNLIRVDQGKLPIHGSMARIVLKNGKSAVAMFVGDSGAGKSETLDALNRLEEVAYVDVIIDDMGSLDIVNGRVVAYGTETGAFVRLDDLPPGYAYYTMDRSIFMNPDKINARVIVPFNNYKEVITPTPIDFFFYANNYTETDNDEDRIVFFDDVEKALEVFSAGRRMSKGTTSEEGMTESYFANPFGAVQRKEAHHKIAQVFMKKMFETGVKVGEIRTMLGVEGYEKEGTYLAAKRLYKIIEQM